jgi:hypothetical protein
MVETNELGSNSFMNAVKGESVVVLGMWNVGAIHNGLVIAKHVAHLMDRNTKILKSNAKINPLVNTRTGCDEFRPIGGSFNGCLFLGVPVDGHLVHKMQAAHHGVQIQDDE